MTSPLDTPVKPTSPLKSPEVGLASLVVDAWVYRESTARFSDGGRLMALPAAWPPPVEPHPDWHDTYAEELAANDYLAGILAQAHGDLGVVYAAAGLSKREAQVYGLRIAGMTWGAIADEIQIARHHAADYHRKALAKMAALLGTSPPQSIRSHSEN